MMVQCPEELLDPERVFAIVRHICVAMYYLHPLSTEFILFSNMEIIQIGVYFMTSSDTYMLISPQKIFWYEAIDSECWSFSYLTSSGTVFKVSDDWTVKIGGFGNAVKPEGIFYAARSSPSPRFHMVYGY